MTFAMVYSFYFLCFGSRRNEVNSLWKKEGGRSQKSTTCSEGISVREFYLPAPTLHWLWAILFIFCVLAPEGMKSIVFGKKKGERSEVYCLIGRENDILQQYNDKFIIYNNSWRYYLISIDSIAEIVSE